MKQLNINKSSIERQNVDVTVQPGVDPRQTSKRTLLPSYRGHKRPDNRALFHSLKRSYVRLTEGSSLEKSSSGLHLRDISPEERTAMHREQYALTKRNFSKNKQLNKYGNIESAFGSPHRLNRTMIL